MQQKWLHESYLFQEFRGSGIVRLGIGPGGNMNRGGTGAGLPERDRGEMSERRTKEF